MENNLNDYVVSLKDLSYLVDANDEALLQLPTININNKSYVSAEEIHKYRKDNDKIPKLINDYKIVTMLNGKGGVGKSTLAVNLAVKASLEGMRVLVVDMDMQANITKTFGIDNPKETITFLNIIKGEVDIEDAILDVRPTLKLLPANGSLARLSNEIDFKDGFEHIKGHLDQIREQFDIVIIDCGPLLNNVNFAVICATDIVLSPVFPDLYSEEGLELTLEEVARAKLRGFNVMHKIVINKFHMREMASKEYLHKYTSQYNEQIAKTIIRTSVDLTNAINANLSIFEYNPKAAVIEDITSLLKEMTTKGETSKRGEECLH